jgi:hypothetical protein
MMMTWSSVVCMTMSNNRIGNGFQWIDVDVCWLAVNAIIRRGYPLLRVQSVPLYNKVDLN